MEVLELFRHPFMQRAVIGGAIVALLTSSVGILTVLRKASFYGDAVAHASLTGVALALLVGVNPVVGAGVYALMVAIVLPYFRNNTSIPLDSILGIIMPVSMGLGVVLLSLVPGYQPELISFLFGSILSITWAEVIVIGGFSLLVGVVYLRLKDDLILTSFDQDQAKVVGVRVGLVDFAYNILLALTIVAGIKVVGIVLVNALLVIPVSTVRLFAKSLKTMFLLTPLVSLVMVMVGLVVSVVLNWPSGPAIAVTAGVIFVVAAVLSRQTK